MKLATNSILLVKYDNGGGERPWVEFRANKGRDLKKIQYTFSTNPNFRFMQIYEYDRKRKLRGVKRGYLDRNKIEY